MKVANFLTSFYISGYLLEPYTKKDLYFFVNFDQLLAIENFKK
jgi:hypothetical protein